MASRARRHRLATYHGIHHRGPGTLRASLTSFDEQKLYQTKQPAHQYAALTRLLSKSDDCRKRSGAAIPAPLGAAMLTSSAATTLGTGLLLGAHRPWGLRRHHWIIAKVQISAVV